MHLHIFNDDDNFSDFSRDVVVLLFSSFAREREMAFTSPFLSY